MLRWIRSSCIPPRLSASPRSAVMRTTRFRFVSWRRTRPRPGSSAPSGVAIELRIAPNRRIDLLIEPRSFRLLRANLCVPVLGHPFSDRRKARQLAGHGLRESHATDGKAFARTDTKLAFRGMLWCASYAPLLTSGPRRAVDEWPDLAVHRCACLFSSAGWTRRCVEFSTRS